MRHRAGAALHLCLSYKEQAALISKYPTAPKAARDFTAIFISSANAKQVSAPEGMTLN